MNLEFTIKNIKGYGDPAIVRSIDVLPRKINLVYAPNGSGKSTLTAALRNLERGGLNVPKYDRYKKSENVVCKLSVKIDHDDAQTYVAHKGVNQISAKLHPFVIDSRLIGKTHNEEGLDDAQLTKGILYVKPIVLVDEVPEDIKCVYSLEDIRGTWGRKSKVLKSIDAILSNHSLFQKFEAIETILEFSTKPRMTAAIEVLKEKLNSLEGNYNTLHDRVEDKHFSRIHSYGKYQTYLQFVRKQFPTIKNDLDRFLFFYQLRHIYNQDSAVFHKAVIRAKYDVYKEKLVGDAEVLKTSWQKFKLVDDTNQLIAEFPQSDEVSSGQRDVMILRVLLDLFEKSLVNGINLLVIDDVFEYLDDANKIVAEYYLKKLLNKRSDDIFIVLLSHLEKRNFRTHLISEKDIHEVYLLGSDCARVTDVKGLTAFREKLNEERIPGDAKDVLYGKISKYLFHYAPTTEDLRMLIHPYVGPGNIGLKEKYGDKNTFFTFLVDELNKYFANGDYDPYAVATAVRILEEKKLYEALEDDKKPGFIDTYETLRKIEYCENNGINVPDSYRFVTSIHNEADHCTANPDGTFKEKGMVYSLKNKSVKDIISNIIGYTEGKQYVLADML